MGRGASQARRAAYVSDVAPTKAFPRFLRWGKFCSPMVQSPFRLIR